MILQNTPRTMFFCAEFCIGTTEDLPFMCFTAVKFLKQMTIHRSWGSMSFFLQVSTLSESEPQPPPYSIWWQTARTMAVEEVLFLFSCRCCRPNGGFFVQNWKLKRHCCSTLCSMPVWKRTGGFKLTLLSCLRRGVPFLKWHNLNYLLLSFWDSSYLPSQLHL